MIWDAGSVRTSRYHCCCLPLWIPNCSSLLYHCIMVLGKKLSMIAGWKKNIERKTALVWGSVYSCSPKMP